MKMGGIKSLTVKAIIFNVVLFSLFFLFTKPEYYCDEDVTAAYLLSGGFGNLPTELLHYDHLLNPMVGYPLKFLFEHTRGINWYVLSIIGLHFVAFTSILICFLKRLKAQRAICVYILLFIIYEAWLLMNLGFNSTSLVLTIAGVNKLYEWRLTGANNPHKIYTGIVFFLLAAFFRIHVMIPLIGCSLPFIFLPFNFKIGKQLILVYLVTAILILGFNLVHKAYYSTAIPNWQTEEEYRQILYRFYNDSRVWQYSGEKFNIEFDLLRMGLPCDPEFLTKSKLMEMYSAIKMNSNRNQEIGEHLWYWFFMNLRLYIFVFLFFGIYFFYRSSVHIGAIVSLLLLVFGLFILGYYAKSPLYLLISCCLLWLNLFALSFGDKFKSAIENFLFIFLSCLFVIWGIIRLQKMSDFNTAGRKKFDAYYSYIRQHPGNLFINTMGEFSIRKVPVFSDPRDYLLRNLLDGDLYFMNLYKEVLNRFQISTFNKIPFSSRVIFLGEPNQSLTRYFESFGYKLKVENTSTGNCKLYTIKAY